MGSDELPRPAGAFCEPECSLCELESFRQSVRGLDAGLTKMPQHRNEFVGVGITLAKLTGPLINSFTFRGIKTLRDGEYNTQSQLHLQFCSGSLGVIGQTI